MMMTFAQAVILGQLATGVQPVADRQIASTQTAMSSREACKADFQALCSDVAPGGGRVKACLVKNKARLSDECRSALGASRS